MASKIWPDKDPDEQLDYAFDWSPRKLEGDTIVATEATVIGDSTVEVVAHAAASSALFPNAPTGQVTVTWLKGGVAGEKCTILLQATTSRVPPRILEQTVTIKIKDR